MRIFYPVPVDALPKLFALQEHYHILKIHDDIMVGNGRYPDLMRWERHIPALYDRYHQSLKFLNERHDAHLSNGWVHQVLVSGIIVYPDIGNQEVADLWNAVMVEAARLDY